MTTNAWKIKDWEERFTVSQSRREVKTGHRPRYVPIPINLGGESYRVLMASDEGRDAFAVFIGMVEIAAQMPVQGVLSDEKGPLSVKRISDKTGIPPRAIEAAITMLTNPEIGWLQEVAPRRQRSRPLRASPEPTPSQPGANSAQSREEESREEEKPPIPRVREAASAAADPDEPPFTHDSREVQAALSAVSRWANATTGAPLKRSDGSASAIEGWLVEHCGRAPPLPLDGTEIPALAGVPRIVEDLIARGKGFTKHGKRNSANFAWAYGVLNTALDDWRASGNPPDAPGSERPPAAGQGGEPRARGGAHRRGASGLEAHLARQSATAGLSQAADDRLPGDA
jgi:hypothetical protein